MKRIVLSIFSFLLVSVAAFAQVEVTSGSIVLEAEGADEIYQDILIANTSDQPIEIYWIYEPADGYPENWRTQLCDLNLCYAWDSFVSSPNLPNMIEPGQEVTFTIKVQNVIEGLPVNGNSCGILRLYDDKDKANEVYSTSCVATSTTDLYSGDIVIYPNPTSETFQLKNDKNVSSISIHNIVGRLIRKYNHSEGMVHDVTDLRTGMYLVRFEDAKGNTLKSMRLSKK